MIILWYMWYFQKEKEGNICETAVHILLFQDLVITQMQIHNIPHGVILFFPFTPTFMSEVPVILHLE